ncbi:unnamed protein product [Vitrella brassicaformis CCMP3155]|uniref:Uncharacterized protein n=1 Tax=Vitrella brassicaformis (strain CCMP3155) TaxID=1169540 RepID=A0A0G4ES53_VITBC|nr:unnamed protein product [Vitrella brassicaformis CCMP3155]|eukprot:CEM00323.1 unnamed protein product [Vitrella brassicaformis CCMP3155]
MSAPPQVPVLKLTGGDSAGSLNASRTSSHTPADDTTRHERRERVEKLRRERTQRLRERQSRVGQLTVPQNEPGVQRPITPREKLQQSVRGITSASYLNSLLRGKGRVKKATGSATGAVMPPHLTEEEASPSSRPPKAPGPLRSASRRVSQSPNIGALGVGTIPEHDESKFGTVPASLSGARSRRTSRMTPLPPLPSTKEAVQQSMPMSSKGSSVMPTSSADKEADTPSSATRKDEQVRPRAPPLPVPPRYVPPELREWVPEALIPKQVPKPAEEDVRRGSIAFTSGPGEGQKARGTKGFEEFRQQQVEGESSRRHSGQGRQRNTMEDLRRQVSYLEHCVEDLEGELQAKDDEIDMLNRRGAGEILKKRQDLDEDIAAEWDEMVEEITVLRKQLELHRTAQEAHQAESEKNLTLLEEAQKELEIVREEKAALKRSLQEVKQEVKTKEKEEKKAAKEEQQQQEQQQAAAGRIQTPRTARGPDTQVLELKMKALNSTVLALEKKCEALETQVTYLTEEKEELQSLLEASRRDRFNQQSTHQLQLVSKKSDVKEADINFAKELKFRSKWDDASPQSRLGSRSQVAIEDECEILRENCKDLEEENDELKQEVDDLLDEIEDLRAQIEQQKQQDSAASAQPPRPLVPQLKLGGVEENVRAMVQKHEDFIERASPPPSPTNTSKAANKTSSASLRSTAGQGVLDAADTQKTISGLPQQVEEGNRTIEALRAREGELERELQKTQEERQATEGAEKSSAAKTAELQEKLRLLEDKNQSLESEAARLSGLQDTLKKMEDELITKTEAAQQLAKQRDELQQQLDQGEGVAGKLREQLTSKSDEIEKLTTTISTIEEDKRKLQESTSKLQLENEELTATIASLKSSCSALESQLSAEKQGAQQGVETAEKQLSKLRADMDEVTLQNNAATDELKRLHESQIEQDKAQQQLTADLAAANSAKSLLEAELSAAKAAASATSEERANAMAEVESALASAQQAVAEKEREIETLKTERKTVDDQLAAALSAKKDLELEVSSLKSAAGQGVLDAADSQKTISGRTNQIEEGNRTIEALKTREGELQRELQKTQEERQELQAQFEKSQEESAHYKAAHDETVQRIHTLTGEKQALESEIGRITAEKENLQSQVTAASAHTAPSTATLRRLMAESAPEGIDARARVAAFNLYKTDPWSRTDEKLNYWEGKSNVLEHYLGEVVVEVRHIFAF